MREADYDKAFNDLEAKKEFDKKREASFLGIGVESAGARNGTRNRAVKLLQFPLP